MRRNVECLLVSVVITVAGTACSLSPKKSVEVEPVVTAAAEGKDDLWLPTASPVQEWADESDAYPTYGEPTALESAYETPEVADEEGRQPGPRYHTVAKNNTLYGLARMYYSDQARWKDIYEANRSVISDPNKIRIGQRLLIP